MPKFKPYFDRRYRVRERLIAILALLNLGLVFFDFTYLWVRDFYLLNIPSLTQFYDPIKGIKPHPATENYLQQVEVLSAQIITNGLQSPQVESLLAQQRLLSQKLIDENPFAGANKSSKLETIKQEIRVQTGEIFASDAFTRFWSQPYLTQRGWQQEIAFWNTQIRPLIQSNYYRGVNRIGTNFSYFWLLDLPFVLIFTWDFLARILTIHHRYPELTWLEVILRRWYDLLLLLPFWRWLRIIPVSARLYHVGLLNIEPVRVEVQRDLVVSFAVEMTEMIGILIIDQMQASIQRGDFIDWLFHPKPPKQPPQEYVQVNDKNEVTAIASHLFDIGVRDVLPQVQPEIEDLVQHSIATTLNQLPGYRRFQHLPGLRRLQLSRKLAKSLFKITYKNLIYALKDPVGAEITTRLRTNLKDALERELQKKDNIQEIQSLLIDMLEDIKLNYIKSIAEVQGDQLLEKAEQLHKRIR
ncbi:hypothetical protein ACF3DV_23935 [Chlorogloeopsis fritschii PCC 9212]|uniref:Uncharacterized protein n=1 Tax=Chlorogloeopsis fritschii PCC 6912 TaxID=211165 RepID=A0A3S0Y765_CHLFR|nr:hypothetical protein [Chlorogloeopsis fritschii]RUR85883.1 hypothetical protein PCC6912_07080 [Chlorogloeopsis fritschii PCC 6912]